VDRRALSRLRRGPLRGVGAGRVLPGLAVLRRYQRAWLPHDLLAGVTVAAYLVPQVMAYAEVAGLHPAAGLWAAVPALVLYPLLGSSASLSMAR
jgi:sulfate permease, SulP family